MSSRKRGAEQGSASVLVLGVVLVGAVAAALWLAGGHAALARQHAESAADLAALAAARVATDPRGVDDDAATACGEADGVARRNGARLTSCRVTGEQVSVTAAVDSPTDAYAEARAGPQEEDR